MRFWLGAALIGLTVFFSVAFFTPIESSWNINTHIFLTVSIVDRGTLNIDPYISFTGDRSLVNGHFYADKAPGLSLMAVPFYLVEKAVLLHGKPYLPLLSQPVLQGDYLARYYLTLWMAGLPTVIATMLLFYLFSDMGLSSLWGGLLALTYGLGTMARGFAGEIFSHQLSAALLLGAFVLLYRVRRGQGSYKSLILTGFLLGYAFISEYPTALIIAVLGLYALTFLKTHWQSWAAFVAGTIIPLLIGATYNTIAFGRPWRTGYSSLASGYAAEQTQGLMGITYPHLVAIWQTSFGPYRGMFLLSPVLVLALPGFIYLWRRKEWRREVVACLAIVFVYEWFSVSYFEWDGGWSMGPRQFLPALPFLMLPIGELVMSYRAVGWKIATFVLSLISILIVELATATGPLFNSKYPSPLTQLVWPDLQQGMLDYNWAAAHGVPGHAQIFLLMGGMAVLIFAFVLSQILYGRTERKPTALAHPG